MDQYAPAPFLTWANQVFSQLAEISRMIAPREFGGTGEVLRGFEKKCN
jgi:hypothetical protein